MRIASPQLEQFRAFQDELVAIRGEAEPVEQPFPSVPRKKVLVVIAAFASKAQQSVANGGGYVSRSAFAHTLASR